jgi:hypothetical protein
LLNGQVGPNRLVQEEAGAITEDGNQCPWDTPALGRN